MANRRNCKYVERFQLRLFFRVVAYGLVFQFTLWNLLFGWRLLEQGPGNLLEQYRQFLFEYYPILIGACILAPVFGWDAVKFSHRVAGPIYRFRATLRQITAGEPVNLIRLRAKDELLDMRDEFNEMLLALAKKKAITLVETGRNSETESGDPDTIDMDEIECDALQAGSGR